MRFDAARKISKESAERTKSGNLSVMVCGFTIFCCFSLFVIFLCKFFYCFFEDGIIKGDFSYTLLYGDAIFFCIIIAFLLTPIIVGWKRLTYLCAKGEKPELKHIFYYFTSGKRYGNALLINLLVMVRVAIIGMFLMSVYFSLLHVLEFHLRFCSSSHYCKYIFSAVLAVTAIVFIAVLFHFRTRYFVSYYLFIDEKCSPLQSIRLSVKIMKSQKKNYYSVLLYHFPYIFLCIFIFPAFYCYPQIQISFSITAKWIIDYVKRKGFDFDTAAEFNDYFEQRITHEQPNFKNINIYNEERYNPRK